MASLRKRTRIGGSEFFSVLYRLDGKQSSTSFEDFDSADAFRKFADKYGPEKALHSIRTAYVARARAGDVSARRQLRSTPNVTSPPEALLDPHSAFQR